MQRLGYTNRIGWRNCRSRIDSETNGETESQNCPEQVVVVHQHQTELEDVGTGSNLSYSELVMDENDDGACGRVNGYS